MKLLDMRTVLLSYAVSNLISIVVMAFLWRRNRSRFAGLELWMADFVLQFLGLSLISLRGLAPDLLTATLSNTLVIGGTILMLAGLERFVGLRNRQTHNLVLLSAFVLAHVYFLTIRPNLGARTILFSVALLALCLQCADLMLRRVERGQRVMTRGVGYVFAAFGLVSLVRIVVDLLVPTGDDFLRSNAFDTLVLLTYQMLYIALTFSLFLMVNRRLFAELEGDRRTLEEAEASLRQSEEKFSKAFRSSPDAVIISRLSDGRLIEVNEGFCGLTGYSREEALSSSTIALGLWIDAKEREHLVTRLREASRVRDFEFDARMKSGKRLRVLFSSELITVNGEECALSVFHDVSERTRADSLMALRLGLWEYSSLHSAQEVMQKALDEIEALTDSSIGFYHIVDEDGRSLTLQAWSTRTRKEFCKAEGEGMHYPIEEAGVWVDCLRLRRPVIHNDYASLPNRRGMPPGHATVVRELVVPSMRDGRVVSILGVGNKASDYEEGDIELVAYIADVVWTIVAKLRADEEIRRLNKELERMAMTDELTGLMNRRSFLIQGGDEIRRTKRYGSPLSLVMIDLDRFKNVNDAFGHETGDEVLRRVAKAMLETLREVDMAARLGGEEFGVLLPNTKAADAAILAERLRSAIAGATCSMGGRSVGVTASVGVATYREEWGDLDAMLRNADDAMYKAKNLGRNRVVSLG